MRKKLFKGEKVNELDVVLTVGKDFDVDEAISIYTSKIWVNDWVGMKYKYNNDACSHLVSTEQTKRLLREYKRAVLIVGKKMKDFKIAVLAMEKELIKNGFYKSLALINGPCDFCSSVDIDPEIKRIIMTQHKKEVENTSRLIDRDLIKLWKYDKI